MDATLLQILRCPETYQTLRVADGALIQSINDKIRSGALKNRGGQNVIEAIDEGLIREDQKFIYPVRGRIPVMLIDEAIPLH